MSTAEEAGRARWARGEEGRGGGWWDRGGGGLGCVGGCGGEGGEVFRCEEWEGSEGGRVMFMQLPAEKEWAEEGYDGLVTSWNQRGDPGEHTFNSCRRVIVPPC